jgi:hypothetical protein
MRQYSASFAHHAEPKRIIRFEVIDDRVGISATGAGDGALLERAEKGACGREWACCCGGAVCDCTRGGKALKSIGMSSCSITSGSETRRMRHRVIAAANRS